MKRWYFRISIRDGYIYGYIFYSGRSSSVVLDEGVYEYPIDAAEILIDSGFILIENLTLALLKSRGLYGSRARIADDKELVKYDARMHL